MVFGRDRGPDRRRGCRSDIHAITKDVTVLDYDVAHVDADAELDAVVRSCGRIALSHASLHFRRTDKSFHHTAELDEQSVACGLDQPAIVRGNRGSITSARITLSAWRVPPSSAPISRE
jgi:hypothetical protein